MLVFVGAANISLVQVRASKLCFFTILHVVDPSIDYRFFNRYSVFPETPIFFIICGEFLSYFLQQSL